MKRILFAVAAVCAWGIHDAAAAPYPFLDPGYTARIVSDPFQGATGVAFTADGRLIRSDGSRLGIHSATPDITVSGTPMHSYTLNTVGGAGLGGYGMVLGNDGFLYHQGGGGGIKKVDLTTFTSTVLPNSQSGYYGMKLLPDGNLVYNANDNTIRKYNLATNTDSFIYNTGTFNDDLAVSPDGHIFIAALGSNRVDIITQAGVLVNSITTAHIADGMAFGQGAVFKNNTDGTITRLDFAGPNFTGAATETLIASGGGYGDLAAVNPVDHAFYVDNDAPFYDDGIQRGGRHVIALEFEGGGGFGDDPTTVPEPATLAVLATGLIGLGWARRRKAG